MADILTWNQVGVYFKVDKDRCFFAHITSKTPEVEDSRVVTEQVGEDIGSQVKRRLCSFLRIDNWDIKDPEFGKDLLLQCPCLRDKAFDGGTYYTPGKFVVKAIREFFMACAQLLEEDVTQRRATPHSEGSQTSQNAEYRRETWRLVLKSEFLNRTGTTTEVNDDHHIMIISPLTGATWRFGEVRNPPREIQKEDLGEHVPVELDLREGICGFGVLEDDRAALAPSLLTTESERAEALEMVEWDRREYQSFAEGVENATARRLSTLLENTHLPAVPEDPDDVSQSD
jgi:hypothetical protein